MSFLLAPHGINIYCFYINYLSLVVTNSFEFLLNFSDSLFLLFNVQFIQFELNKEKNLCNESQLKLLWLVFFSLIPPQRLAMSSVLEIFMRIGSIHFVLGYTKCLQFEYIYIWESFFYFIWEYIVFFIIICIPHHVCSCSPDKKPFQTI